jgi:putative flippase GtrA
LLKKSSADSRAKPGTIEATIIDSLTKAKGLTARNRWVQFVVYLMIGGFTAVINLSLLYLFTDVLRIWYLLSSGVAYVISLIIHYTLNRVITFQNTSKAVAKQFIVYLCIAFVSLGLNLLLLSFFVEVLKVWYLLAQVFVILIVFIFNYVAHRTITFRIFK